jgi:dTDP-4-amino-4,6-dideoxygalactose transaminase
LPVVPDGRTHVYHQYTLDVGGARDAILAELREAGIGADVYYPLPVHRQSYIQERGLHADLPVTDAAAARTLALPMFPGLTDAEADQVIAAVGAAVEKHLGPDGAARAVGATTAGSAA